MKPTLLSDLVCPRENRVWLWVTNVWMFACALAAGLLFDIVFGPHVPLWLALLVGVPAGLLAAFIGLCVLVVPIYLRKRQLLRRRT